MKQIVELMELSERAAAVGWNLADLSLAAGMARSTAYKVIGHGNPTKKTEQALSDALITREIHLRDYLLGLHPLAQLKEAS